MRRAEPGIRYSEHLAGNGAEIFRQAGGDFRALAAALRTCRNIEQVAKRPDRLTLEVEDTDEVASASSSVSYFGAVHPGPRINPRR